VSWVESQVWTAVERGPTRGLDGLITIRRQRGTRDYYWEVVLVDVERIESGSCDSLRGAKTKAREGRRWQPWTLRRSGRLSLRRSGSRDAVADGPARHHPQHHRQHHHGHGHTRVSLE